MKTAQELLTELNSLDEHLTIEAKTASDVGNHKRGHSTLDVFRHNLTRGTSFGDTYRQSTTGEIKDGAIHQYYDGPNAYLKPKEYRYWNRTLDETSCAKPASETRGTMLLVSPTRALLDSSESKKGTFYFRIEKGDILL